MLALAKKLYRGQKVSNAVKGRRAVRGHVRNLPRGIDLSEGSMAFDRAMLPLLEPDSKQRQRYTVVELRAALKENLFHNRAYDWCHKQYGIPETTLKRHIKALTKLFNCANRKELIKFHSLSDENTVHLEKSINEIVLPKTGPDPLLDQTEVDLLFSIANKKNEAGFNQCNRTIAVETLGLCKEKAEVLPAGKLKDRFNNLQCSRKFIRTQQKRIASSLKKEGGSGFKKNSAISVKRAQAANPVLDAIMKKKIQDFYQDLRDKGVEIPESGPPPSTIWNGDEKGVSTNAKFPPSFTLGGTTRHFSLVAGERSNFWTTLFYWIRGDGKVPIAPVVVHQGGTENEIPAKFTDGLPADWRVCNTSSGYMDKNGFYHCIESLVEYIKKARDDDGNDQHHFIFLDGHDSHFSHSALQLAEENNIHIFFLKSNDSINDQPADMGANAIFEKYYQAAMQEWRRKYVVTPFNVQFMNEVLVTAYTAFIKDKKVYSDYITLTVYCYYKFIIQ